MIYCKICNRPIKKGKGPIGPVCLRKLNGEKIKIRKPKIQKLGIDLFEEEEEEEIMHEQK